MNVFIGLDVSLKDTAVCVLTEKGDLLKEAKVASEPADLVAFVHELGCEIGSIGLEAGPLSQWLHKALTDAGFETVLMETRRVNSALKAIPIKTDRRDAEGIARLLHLGWFRPVHCKSVSAQEHRAILTARKAIQKTQKAIEQSVRGVLRGFGLKMGAVSEAAFEARVCELVDGNTMLEVAIAPQLRLRNIARAEFDGLDKQVERFAKADPVCQLLMTMPGVGPITSLTFKTAVDDPNQFRRSRDIGPWVGLTPGRHQSGELDISGKITKAGDAGLRAALYMAAQAMLKGRHNWLKSWALRLATRRGKKFAKVALSRRIGVVLHRMMSDGTEFCFTRDEAMAMRAA